jgi:uncharacterized protein YhaN
MATKKRPPKGRVSTKKPAKDRISDLLDTALSRFEARVAMEDFYPSVADYLKLMQLKKELEEEVEAIREIKVTWVETEDSENSP